MPRAGQEVLRRWRITVNHSDEEDEAVIHDCNELLQSHAVGDHHIRLGAWQLERGHETDRLHIQAYFEFSRAVRRTHLRAVFGRIVDARACDGGTQANLDYVTKEDTREDGPWTIGQPPQQGRRTDLEQVRQLVDEGATELQCWDAHFATVARYGNAIRRYQFLRQQHDASQHSEPVAVSVFWGDTGLGKSRRARWEARDAGYSLFDPDIPDAPNGVRWFDGYDGQDAMLLDDYAGEYGLNFFKRLIDRYSIKLAVKGGFTMRRVKHIYITSNTNPADWYPTATQADKDAIQRRFFVCEHFTVPWLPPDELPDAQPLSPDIL